MLITTLLHTAHADTALFLISVQAAHEPKVLSFAPECIWVALCGGFGGEVVV